MNRCSALRRVSLCLTVGLGVAATAACTTIAPGSYDGNSEQLLSRGTDFLHRLERIDGTRLSDEEVLALGYAERVRLGLGSPFRTIEYLLRDPDLTEAVRTRTAYGLLDRISHGRSYEIEPEVLELARLFGVSRSAETGTEQLRLIEQTVAGAPSAIAGERSVRLGYLLAGGERTVAPDQHVVFVYAAAMTADRRRAREDALRLLRTAEMRSADPLELLVQWRRDLRFAVEAPTSVDFALRDEESESRAGPDLALALRSLAQREAGRRGSRRSKAEAGVATLLDRTAATRLLELSAGRNYPAQAPVAVAVAINREGLLSGNWLRPGQVESRERFADASFNEERLAASAALLKSEGAWSGVRPSLIVLQAAAFFRSWNQEEPWMPGDGAPTARELQARFGLGALTFDEDIPQSWHPYHLRMLSRALTDLQKALPGASVRGMNLHFGEAPTELSALALHEPRTRTLYLPAATGAGTLAHELAHDLDWQLAGRRYGSRGGYATDLAVRDLRGDRIASALMELSTSLARPGTEPRAHQTRPAEVFARGTDWLVSSVLAREGRTSGYLTSFQNEDLTGYGTTRGPDLSGAAVPALFSLLDAVAPVPEPHRGAILKGFGPTRKVRALELSRAVIEAGQTLEPMRRLPVIHDVAERSFDAANDCRYGSEQGVRRMMAARRELAEWSVHAAARGAAVDGVRRLAEEVSGPAILPAVDRWLAWRLYGAPEPVDPHLDAMAPAFEDIFLRAALIEQNLGTSTTHNPFQTRGTAPLCGGNPFATSSGVTALGR